MEQRMQHKLLTQIVNNLQSSPKACLWFAANLGIAVNTVILLDMLICTTAHQTVFMSPLFANYFPCNECFN
jgi:hypothetical protein